LVIVTLVIGSLYLAHVTICQAITHNCDTTKTEEHQFFNYTNISKPKIKHATPKYSLKTTPIIAARNIAAAKLCLALW